MYPHTDDTLARAVADALRARDATLAVAETTAGGLISARLLSVPGASALTLHPRPGNGPKHRGGGPGTGWAGR